MAKASACCLSRAQAPIQACCRPGLWLPGARNAHIGTETWSMSVSPEEAIDAVIKAVGAISEEENLEVRNVDKQGHFVELWSFTPGCNWLDVVEIRFQTGSEAGTTTAHARSFSTGVCPAVCPLTFICNCLCFCAPFSGNGFNNHRLEALRKAITDTNVVMTEHGPNCC